MFQRILVATDGSNVSHAAVESAIQMAKEQGAQLRMIYVMDLYGYYFSGGEAIAFFDEEGKLILEQAIAQARQAGVMAESHLAETVNGPRVADVITEEAKQCPSDLTVVGGHRRRGVKPLVARQCRRGHMSYGKHPGATSATDGARTHQLTIIAKRKDCEWMEAPKTR